MGATSSSFRSRRMIVEGLAEGTIVTATSLEDGQPFKIKLMSPDAVAEGASAAVLKGKIVAGSDKEALVVALKVFRLPFNAAQRDLYRKLYSRELDAAQRLGAQDRFILPFLGTSVLGFQPVIISQFMRNGNILDYIVKCRPFKVHRQSLMLSPRRPVHPRPGDNITALGLTDAWWNICLACWEFEPERRPSIGDVWKNLRVRLCHARRPSRKLFNFSTGNGAS
ncbi:hypothetical protein AURDEDRAFT_129404 [Auricularia subglabra TFB-10046 SS5]|uniref:Protein kinase domain-containing protein n=1 Tax=Auricularia subglabra (strain TFB-10046 / SS5) TaxID=717982 RepID=J0WUD8_AURST|nr:hypothetical protein AURDEDRAFT_129404 [Auricularia subglabra TFB-10046 SS5]